MNRNLVEIALQELTAEDRALLELSVVRKVSDQDIAELLGADIADVLIKREEALGRVSAMLDDDPERVLRAMRDLPTGRWRGGQRETEQERQTDHEPEPQPEPEPEPEPAPADPELEPWPLPGSATPEPEPWPEKDRGHFMLALLSGLAIMLAVVVIVVLNNDDNPASEPDAPAQKPPAQKPTAKKPAPEKSGALEAIGQSGATGNARIAGSRLSLDVRGLPKPASGGYVVWVYNSVTEARAVAATREGTFKLRARLPGSYRRYRFIDVSREPSDGNPNHSGQSVMRVPLSGLQ